MKTLDAVTLNDAQRRVITVAINTFSGEGGHPYYANKKSLPYFTVQFVFDMCTEALDRLNNPPDGDVHPDTGTLIDVVGLCNTALQNGGN